MSVINCLVVLLYKFTSFEKQELAKTLYKIFSVQNK